MSLYAIHAFVDKEDAHTLFGFFDKDEELFRQLISVSE